MVADKFIINRFELEQVLVQQFRLLQELIELSKKERAALLNEPELVPQLVEDKEVLLDKMGLMEDKCRQVIQEFSISLGIHLENTSIQALLPFLKQRMQIALKNLSEEFTTWPARRVEINHASQAIAVTKLDWLKATQSFLISMFQPESGYRSPMSGTHQEPATGLGVEFRA